MKATVAILRRDGLTVERDEHGRYVHSFRQSWLNTAALCLERARVERAGLMPEEEADAAAIGTAVHYGIEGGLHGLQNADPWTPDGLMDLALAKFDELVNGPAPFRWHKYTEGRARRLIIECMDLFWSELYHQLDPILIEHTFKRILLYQDKYRVIYVEGQIDLYCGTFGAIDFKTTGDGRRYRGGWGGEGWQLERWAVQPIVYLFALERLGVLDGPGPWPFTYFPFDLGAKGGVTVDPFPVKRSVEDFSWLARMCVNLAEQIEANLRAWPVQDNHALCSEKYCGNWGNCKGAHYVGVDWPKGREPVGTVD